MPKRLNKAQLDHLRSQQAIFQAVEQATGVPWEAIAAIWYRETNSVAPPKDRVGGPFQFDPPPSDNRIAFLLDTYSTLSREEKLDIIAKGVDDFRSGAFVAACHGRDRCNPKITPNATDSDIKDFFWGYNGKAYGSAEKSPYVFNGYDTARDGMILSGTVRDKNGNKVRIKPRPEQRPGAFIVYKQLKGEL